jgi:hypothetical protein
MIYQQYIMIEYNIKKKQYRIMILEIEEGICLEYNN